MSSEEEPKTIRDMLDFIKSYSLKLKESLEQANENEIKELLRVLKRQNYRLYRLAKRENKDDLVEKSQEIAAQIKTIKRNQDDPKECIKYIGVIIELCTEEKIDLAEYVSKKYGDLTPSTKRMIQDNVRNAKDRVAYAKAITAPSLIRLAKLYDKEAGPTAQYRVIGAILDLARKNPSLLSKFAKLMKTKEAVEAIGPYAFTDATDRIMARICFNAEKLDEKEFKVVCGKIASSAT